MKPTINKTKANKKQKTHTQKIEKIKKSNSQKIHI